MARVARSQTLPRHGAGVRLAPSMSCPGTLRVARCHSQTVVANWPRRMTTRATVPTQTGGPVHVHRVGMPVPPPHVSEPVAKGPRYQYECREHCERRPNEVHERDVGVVHTAHGPSRATGRPAVACGDLPGPIPPRPPRLVPPFGGQDHSQGSALAEQATRRPEPGVSVKVTGQRRCPTTQAVAANPASVHAASTRNERVTFSASPVVSPARMTTAML